MMVRRRWLLWLAAMVVVLGGCGQGSGRVPARGDGLDRLREQAREALDRYDKAVAAAGGPQAFTPVGELTGQVGDWEPANGENKLALIHGRLIAANPLPAAPRPTGEVAWDNGATRTVALISATDALAQLAAAGTGDCPDCVPLEVTGARMTTARIQTTRGAATAPAWEYTLKGTAVRVTRVAIADSTLIRVTPPSWDPYNAPGGLAIESATATMPAQTLTVAFTGTPQPASQPCGADYTAEAVESTYAVVVIIIEHHHSAFEACNLLGAPRTATVELAAPLGDRAVLEVQQGRPVPVTIDG